MGVTDAMVPAPLAQTAALVTGAASGLGRAAAQRLRQAGAEVVGIDLGAVPDAEFEIIHGSVADPEVVDRALDRIGRTGIALRTVVNCAGVRSFRRLISDEGPFPLNHFREVLEVNLMGTINVTSRAAMVMAAQPPAPDGVRGVVVNTSSIAAYDGLPGQAAYTASKAAVAGLTLQLARDLAEHAIRVVAIAPGVMETPMLSTLTDERRLTLTESVVFPPRLGRPSEFAELLLALVLNPYVNGEVIRVDGALRMTRG